jgi:hypothetical protein
MNRVREITTGQISSPDRHAVGWAPLLLILSDVSHWKIVGRKVVYGEVALSIVGPGSRSSLRELTSAALPFNLRRCTTAWHVSSLLAGKPE